MSNRLRKIRRLETEIAAVAGVALNAAILLPYSCLTALIASQADVGVYEQRNAALFGLLFGAVSLANLTGLLLRSEIRCFRAIQGVLVAVNVILALLNAILANVRPRMFPFDHPNGYLLPISLFTLSAIALYFRRPLRWP